MFVESGRGREVGRGVLTRHHCPKQASAPWCWPLASLQGAGPSSLGVGGGRGWGILWLSSLLLLCRLMLGFMCATAFLSMWISNTATTAMMVPIVEAVLQQMEATSAATEASLGTLELAEKGKAGELPGEPLAREVFSVSKNLSHLPAFWSPLFSQAHREIL